MTMRKDIEATRAQHFEDKRSYIAPDGREVLYGKDWKARCYLVWCRAGGRCEQVTFRLKNPRNFERCRVAANDTHHKIKRSKQRDDRLENLEALCRYHHDLRHPEKKLQWSGKRSG